MPADPRIWILSRGRKGDLDQMLALSRALGWPFELKKLSFRGPEIPVLSKRLLQDGADLLAGPWPDLVFCAEAMPSVIAKEIRRASGGAARAVCIGRPAGAASGFDLVITTAQYRVPPAANVVELSMPLAADAGAEAEARGPVPEGVIALLVGGPAFPDRLDVASARQLASDALAHAEARHAVLHVLTSPRTPQAVVAVLKAAIGAPHRLQVFGEGENRYREVLRAASEIVVTSDSVSMVSDALASGRPVSVYPLPLARNLTWRAGEWLHRNAVVGRRLLFAPARWMFDSGLIEAAADRRLLFARLVSERRLSWFGADLAPPQPGAARQDLARAVASVRALMGE